MSIHRVSCMLLWSVAMVSGASAQIISGPWLQQPTPGGVVLGFETSDGSAARVDYGPTPALGLVQSGVSQTSSAGTLIHHVYLTDLEPGGRYWYRVATDSVVGEVHTLTVAPDPAAETAFNFLAFSDAQYGGYGTVLEDLVDLGMLPYMAQESGGLDIDQSTGFVIVPGDLVSTGSNHSHWTDHFFGQADDLLQHVPILPALGNHEGNAALYYEYFALPDAHGTERWYTTDYGNVRVITLDSNNSGSLQLTWLEGELAQAAQMDEIDFVIAQLHHPHESEQWTPGESWFTTAVVELMEVWSTDTGKPTVHVFGHTHGYSRGQRRDHSHLMVNAASAMGSLDYWGYYPNNDYEDFTVSRVDWGFCVFTSTAGDNPQLRLRRISRGNDYIERDNELVDEISIRRFNDPPYTPQGLSPGPGDDPVPGWDLQLESTGFQDMDGDGPLASHWQISADAQDFSNPLVEELKNKENWYRPSNGDWWYSENLVTDPAISRITMRQSVPGCSTLFWRVRHRDDGLKWSDWSEPIAFQTGSSDQGDDAPSPPDGQMGAPRDGQLQWADCLGATAWDVYVGFDADLDDDYRGTVEAPLFQAGTLDPQTTVFWRVDAHRDGEVQVGNVWTFTTSRAYPTDWTDEWRFIDAQPADGVELVSARGLSDLIPQGMVQGDDWTIEDTGIDVPHIDGQPGRFIRMNSVYGAGRGLGVELQAPGSGGDILHWTLVMDLYVAPGQSGRVPLIQGNDPNTNQAELFLNCDTGGFWSAGSGEVGAGSWSQGEWFRLAMRGDYTTLKAAIFIDGHEVVGDNAVVAPDWWWGGGTGLRTWFLTDNGPASETGPVCCSAIALVDDFMGDADIADLGGPNSAGIFLGRWDEWRFGDAAPGDDLPLANAEGESVLTPRGMTMGGDWDIIETDGTIVPHINGQGASAIRLDNVFGNHKGLELYLDHPGNGGQGCCELGQFSFVWDLYLPLDQNDQLQCLWQGNADNANDGELFLDCRDGGFYVAGAGYVGESDWPLGAWFRLVHAVNFAEGSNAIYVNGAQVVSLQNGVDWLYGDGTNLPVWLLTDNGPDFDVSVVYCANAAVIDHVLSAEEAAALGGPSALGIFTGETHCPGDLNSDGVVSVEDVLVVIASWGDPFTVEDLLLVLSVYGNEC
ncbi:MAG: hypothetical protein MK101_03325 [Phycisphaerales bacterium]|nr:hypothetical protein [Phycisphaerales bacterium]